ncbi:MAG: addiction module protein [Verrucomicrobiales bacterium]|nr:addiction module protein [Verrucomicrobiales bacterium]
MNQILDEARQLPPEQVADLLDQLTLSPHQRIEPAVQEHWRKETQRRIAEIESGSMARIPGAAVLARVAEIVGR